MPEPSVEWTPEEEQEINDLFGRGVPLEMAQQIVIGNRLPPEEEGLFLDYKGQKIPISPELENVLALVEMGVPRSVAEYALANLPPSAPFWPEKQQGQWAAALTGYQTVLHKKGDPVLNEKGKATYDLLGKPILYKEDTTTLQATGYDPGWWAVQQALSTQGVVRATLANQQALEASGQAPWQQAQAQAAYQAQARAEALRQSQITERMRTLGGMAPGEEEVMAPFLEQARGVSPAFQRVAGQRLLPDIFAELGMPEKRQQWWQKGISSIAEQLLPETQQEKELMALKRADPWAQLLSQPTFLQQLETRFRGLSPAEKGVTTGRFRPRTRFI